MYIGRSSPVCLKPDRSQVQKKKASINIDQVINDIEACLKYLSEGIIKNMKDNHL